MPALWMVLLVVLLTCWKSGYATAAWTNPVDTSQTSNIDGYVTALYNKIKEKGRFLSTLTSEEMGSLPVGLVREINGKTYVIAIDSASVTPAGASFNAYFRFTFPGTTEELIFGGKNIAFTPGGIGAGKSTKLVLLKGKDIGINEHLDLVFPGDGSNYVEWDCQGFKSANINATFEFDKTWLQPEDKTADKVKAALKVNVTDLSNMMATVDIPAFHIAGLQDFSFKVKNAVADMSDMANPAGFTPSKDMLEDPATPLLWRGFYLQEMEVGLPKQLATQKGRPAVTVKKFYYRRSGR